MQNKKYSFFVLCAIILVVIVGFLVYKFLIQKDIELKTEKSGNINVLLLGKGGGTHDGPDLTDTIILANINPEKSTVNLVSIPRDLWIPDIEAKINKTYYIGKQKNDREKVLLKSVVRKVTGKQVDYIFVIDFSGFVKLIDHIGGIDVNVRRTLDDYKYPIEGKEDDACDKTKEEIIDLSAQIATGSAKDTDAFPCRYKRIRFDRGVQHLTGIEALEFVRSRHGINGEGSDFARSQRQQDVINAVKDKVLSLGILLNPIKVLGAFNIIKDNIDMNAKITEIDDFINLARKMEKAKIKSFVIDFGNESEKRYGLLTEPAPTEAKRFQYNLVPRVGDGNFSEIKDYVTCIEGGYICEVSDEGIIRDPLPSKAN